MSGHSKWKNIAHKKEKTDTQRAKLFTKLSREIIVAVRSGGADPASNSKLKDIMIKARAGNVPADNINRVISKAAGSADGDDFESITYEGYGPSGVAIIVETATDNRNRTAAEMRHYFDKYGGNLGPAGCVSWSFDSKGVLVLDKQKLDEDAVMMHAIDAGASDFVSQDEVFEIYTEPDDFSAVNSRLEQHGYSFLSAQVEMVPRTYVTLTDETDIKNIKKLFDMLEDNDDVGDIWHNWENEQ